jgi:hypothetical protein
MGFGHFRVKAKFGETDIATSAAAMAFMRSLEPSHRVSYHWKVAERMIHFAWMSAEDEALAGQAFKIAHETDNLLTPSASAELIPHTPPDANPPGGFRAFWLLRSPPRLRLDAWGDH